MKKQPARRSRWLVRLVTLCGIGVLMLLLFVVAFVFNPLEGRLVDVRDIVPREVDFFVRKVALADDLAEFPEPLFWKDFAETSNWTDLKSGPMVQSLRQQGVERALQDAREGLSRIRTDSSGFVDLVRDVFGEELLLAGLTEDRTGAAPQPLAQPWWCCYARVTWRIRAAWGLLRWPMVQSQLAKNGINVRNDGDYCVIEAPGAAAPVYATRIMDVLLVGNNLALMEQSVKLSEGSVEEEPFGRAAKYTDGVLARIDQWDAVNQPERVNALEFSFVPNAMDGFRQFAARWPDANSRDSMNDRVLASFLNLKGWNSLSGALLFEPDELSFLGEVVLNSHMHTNFQAQFFRAEQEALDKWLTKFLRMVPENCSAAAALRVPAGDFLQAMVSALDPESKETINDALRRCTFQGNALIDARDLIERISTALLPRTGFVFRKNVPDPQIPVGDISPVPQIAWVFWIRPEAAPLLQEFVRMVRLNAASFGFNKVYHLKMNLSGESTAAGEKDDEDVITEFCNPQIDGTGEFATVLFKDFFVLSNSGPLIRDMFWARNGVRGARSVLASEDVQMFQRELPRALNGFVYVRGQGMVELLDDYRKYAEKDLSQPDPSWMLQNRSSAEDQVRRSKFPQYASVASMSPQVRAQFDEAVQQWMQEEWRRVVGGFSKDSLAGLVQLRALAKTFRSAYVQLDLENNYIRFLGKLVADYR